MFDFIGRFRLCMFGTKTQVMYHVYRQYCPVVGMAPFDSGAFADAVMVTSISRVCMVSPRDELNIYYISRPLFGINSLKDKCVYDKLI